MNRPSAIVGLLAAVALFTAALWRLFDLRFSAGDVYPPASSFRADPLGAKAYFDGLRLLPDREVRRSLEAVRRLGSGADTTLFLLGCAPFDRPWSSAQGLQELSDFLVQGGRLVVTHAPVETEPMAAGFGPGPADAPASLGRHWDFAYHYAPRGEDADGVVPAVAARRTEHASVLLPEMLPLRTATVFTNQSKDWLVLYTRDGAPTVMQRDFGKGTLILLCDAWLHSNEALRAERMTPFLAWLVGPSRRVVFDETHLGTELQAGIMTLARRYRLHGLGAGLLIFLALFIWRQATSLVPRVPLPEDSGEIVTAHDSASGFVNLLRRAVKRGDLVPLCFEEWRTALGRTRPDLAAKAADMQDVVNLENARPARERTPVETYRKLAGILHRRG